ncbi:MAG: type II 3-dehydroquinate dehydratase [Clostridia bacterium]|nr:type II 3-dehydroquinate dehydratase [Clostridia bacterium]
MKILVINGPNLNMLGIREPDLYGKSDYKALIKRVKTHAKKIGVKVKCFQSNHEGAIVSAIQKAFGRYDGIVINAGAYTHTSVAVLDALKAVAIPTVEVHITDIKSREEFRNFSYISFFAEKFIAGKGIDGYLDALDYLKSEYAE